MKFTGVGGLGLLVLTILQNGVPTLSAGISSTDHHILESPKLSQWGDWGDLQHCPSDQVVVGMQLKVHDHQGLKDDTGLNAVKFYCINPYANSEYAGNRVPITSLVGNAGEWKKDFMCPSGTDGKKLVAVGFQMRSESSSGVKDDTAGNNLKLICSDMYQKQKFVVLEGDGNGKGEWTQQQVCWPGYAICGLQTQVEMFKSLDTTGLNNLKVRCCKADVDVVPASPSSNSTKPVDSEETSNTSEDSSLSGLEKDGTKYQHQFHHSEEGSLEGASSGEQELIAVPPNGTAPVAGNEDDSLPQEIARIDPVDNSEADHEEEDRAASTPSPHIPDWDAVVNALEGTDGSRASGSAQDTHHHEDEEGHEENADHDEEEEEEEHEHGNDETSGETTTAATDSNKIPDDQSRKPKSSPRFGQIELINTSTIALSKAPSQQSAYQILGIGSMIILYFASFM